MNTITLSETVAHVGQNVRFIAAIQQITTGKKVLMDQCRICSCYILHVGDASRQFFKITCWGDAPPTLLHSSSTSDSSKDLHPMHLPITDKVVQVGDIVLFSSCRIKLYQGNVEAQFLLRNGKAATSSSIQLLYRKGLYSSTKDVSLLTLYPMIEWYKQYRREFIVMNDVVTLSGAKKRKNRSTIKELRDNMVVSVLCKLRPASIKTNKTIGKKNGVVSELDGVLMCELVMFDSAEDGMLVNLWDQHAEKRFVARLLNHPGAIIIDGVFVSLQALSNRLLANTTLHTTFHLLDPCDTESIALERKIARSKYAVQRSTSFTTPTDLTSFSTFKELKGSSFQGLATLKNIHIEQVCLGRHFGHEATVLARFAARLVEQYCTKCYQTLPELACQDNTTQSHFEACANKCKTRRGSANNASCAWRYRSFTMVLRDAKKETLQVKVEHQTIFEIAGKIEAQALINGSCNASPSSRFNAASAVTSLLNALVEDANQKFEAQLVCSIVKHGDNPSQATDSCQDSSLNEEGILERVYSLVSLVPCDVFTI
ncbi:unnamed protein product [Peronospora belbahrii]|uniref:CST complex subunit CTC1 n=1 Tax=Peronospora belbahrii TaxID=622444 RepID=A0AAU9LAP4_9STRA|nr:unnamed protein product [Peronospora belbahrii]CAH0517870.1 unnamed protein product [Peronospora belbahrii]